MDWRKLLTRDQDTGWRDVSTDLRSGATGTLHIRRVGLTVWWRSMDLVVGTGHRFYWPPIGLRAPVSPLSYPPQVQDPASSTPIYLDGVGGLCRKRTADPLTGGRWWEGSYLLPKGTPPIGDPPGEEVA